MSSFETIYTSSREINGKTVHTTSGIKEESEGRFSPWVKGEQMALFIPRRVPMTRERALMAAEALGRAMDMVVLMSMDQIRDDEDDRSKKRNQL